MPGCLSKVPLSSESSTGEDCLRGGELGPLASVVSMSGSFTKRSGDVGGGIELSFAEKRMETEMID